MYLCALAIGPSSSSLSMPLMSNSCNGPITTLHSFYSWGKPLPIFFTNRAMAWTAAVADFPSWGLDSKANNARASNIIGTAGLPLVSSLNAQVKQYGCYIFLPSMCTFTQQLHQCWGCSWCPICHLRFIHHRKAKECGWSNLPCLHATIS